MPRAASRDPVSGNRKPRGAPPVSFPEIWETVLERGQAYGSPANNHARTARLWSAYLENKRAANGGGELPALTPGDVCFFNILQKIARLQSGSQHRDSLVDVIGYVLNLLEIWEGEDDQTQTP